MEYKPGPELWNDIIAEVLVCDTMTVNKRLPDGSEVPHPSESGLFKRSIGERKGQKADWRASIPGSDRGVHVVEYESCYRIHVDRFDPYKKPIEHVIHDSPKTGIAMAAAGIGTFLVLRHLRKSRGRRRQ